MMSCFKNVHMGLHSTAMNICTAYFGKNVPKVYIERNILDIATASAVIAYNDGAQGLHVMRSLEIEPGHYGHLISEKRDHTRIIEVSLSPQLCQKREERN